jgi:hypothetical protein
MRIQYQNDDADLWAVFGHQPLKTWTAKLVWLSILAILLAAMLGPLLTRTPSQANSPNGRLSQAALFLPLIVIPIAVILTVKKAGKRLAPVTLTLTEEGIMVESGHSRGITAWSGFDRVLRTEKRLFILLTHKGAHVLPRRAFPTQEAFELCFKTCQARMAAARTLPH